MELLNLLWFFLLFWDSWILVFKVLAWRHNSKLWYLQRWDLCGLVALWKRSPSTKCMLVSTIGWAISAFEMTLRMLLPSLYSTGTMHGKFRSWWGKKTKWVNSSPFYFEKLLPDYLYLVPDLGHDSVVKWKGIIYVEGSKYTLGSRWHTIKYRNNNNNNNNN